MIRSGKYVIAAAGAGGTSQPRRAGHHGHRQPGETNQAEPGSSRLEHDVPSKKREPDTFQFV
jgi:hypothetical protein